MSTNFDKNIKIQINNTTLFYTFNKRSDHRIIFVLKNVNVLWNKLTTKSFDFVPRYVDVPNT